MTRTLSPYARRMTAAQRATSSSASNGTRRKSSAPFPNAVSFDWMSLRRASTIAGIRRPAGRAPSRRPHPTSSAYTMRRSGRHSSIALSAASWLVSARDANGAWLRLSSTMRATVVSLEAIRTRRARASLRTPRRSSMRQWRMTRPRRGLDPPVPRHRARHERPSSSEDLRTVWALEHGWKSRPLVQRCLVTSSQRFPLASHHSTRGDRPCWRATFGAWLWACLSITPTRTTTGFWQMGHVRGSATRRV